MKSPVKNFHGRAKGGASHLPPKYATGHIALKVDLTVGQKTDSGGKQNTKMKIAQEAQLSLGWADRICRCSKSSNCEVLYSSD